MTDDKAYCKYCGKELKHSHYQNEENFDECDNCWELRTDIEYSGIAVALVILTAVVKEKEGMIV